MEQDLVADRAVVGDLAIVLPPELRRSLQVGCLFVADLAARVAKGSRDNEGYFAQH